MMAKKEVKNIKKNVKKNLRKIWWFIWESDSALSWIVNIILAFLIIKFVIYPALGFALGTTHPVVAVVSGSMEHKAVPVCSVYIDGSCAAYAEGRYGICGFEVGKKGFLNIDEYYSVCGEWYSENYNITESEFKEYRFVNGFNKGDIMVLVSAKNIKLGDIIVFNADHRNDPIIHRVVQIENGEYTTKGDHNSGSWDFERGISKERIIGKAVIRIPFLGWIKIGFIKLLSFLGMGG